MAHEVWFSIPNRKLGRSDVEFQVWRDKAMLGSLQVSKGSIVWFPSGTTWGYRMGWGSFNELMCKHAKGFEKRR